MNRRLLSVLVLGLGIAAPCACAHGARELVRSGTQGGVTGSLEGMNDPHNKELLLRLLNDPDIHRAAHDLTAALTSGAVDGLTDEQRGERVREASDAYIRTIAVAIGDALDDEVSPAVTRTLEDMVGGGVAGALRPSNRRLAQDLVDGVTRSAVTAFSQSTARGLRDDLGPALREVLAADIGPTLQKVIEDNLGPALHKVIEEDLSPALHDALGGGDEGASGSAARSLTKQIVLGVNDGMSELGMSLSPNPKDGVGVARWLLIVLSGLLVILTAVLVRMFITRRALARDRAHSEEMLVDILRAIKTGESEAPVNLDTVLTRIQQHSLDDPSYLATIVGRAHLPSRSEARTVKPADRPRGASVADDDRGGQ